MASATPILSVSLRLPSSSSSSSVRVPNGVAQFSPFSRACALKLSSSCNISGFAPILPLRRSALNSPSPNQPSSLTVVSVKGYKMKTHKASAKRFRVTGRGKIVRRRAGKQHLLAKKNTKRKLRLSKMVGDLVYVKLKPYQHKSLAKILNEKLSPRYFGPYQVEAQVGQVAYLQAGFTCLCFNSPYLPCFYVTASCGCSTTGPTFSFTADKGLGMEG